MGVVYEALQVDLETHVALKTLWPELTKDAEARERFLREGKAASRTEHPNVVRVLGCGTEGGLTYLVMELLRGETLGQLLGRRAKLDTEGALDILLPVMSAVALGHDRGVVHRDLKPQNIFLSTGYRGELVPKVLDFGVSKFVDAPAATLTVPSTVLGTAAYMAPEQALGLPADARSDQYAIGLILYEMLTGRRALMGGNQYQVLHAAAAAQVIPARDIDPSLGRGIEQVLSRMLERSSEERYPSVRDAGAALLPMASASTRTLFADDFPSASAAGSTTSRAGRPPRKSATAGQTVLLPPALEMQHSTLGRAAAQIVLPGRTRRSRAPLWITAAGLACALGAGAVLFRGVSSSPGEASHAAGRLAEPAPAPEPSSLAADRNAPSIGDRALLLGQTKPVAAHREDSDVSAAPGVPRTSHAIAARAPTADAERTEPLGEKKNHRPHRDGARKKAARSDRDVRLGANGSPIIQ
jgi:serine/threonine-protein kinase